MTDPKIPERQPAADLPVLPRPQQPAHSFLVCDDTTKSELVLRFVQYIADVESWADYQEGLVLGQRQEIDRLRAQRDEARKEVDGLRGDWRLTEEWIVRSGAWDEYDEYMRKREEGNDSD